ncbi:cupin domain-containing protein [Oryzibacter oryziterrae]|uniref:cupin domain-containing protein n=1 Tax=Oryzibacter oryziterrae TaxID=2766474 RepID=UPI001F21D83F|nr:cupin domain-containing protein [Oryzibacter oryziterrae]
MTDSSITAAELIARLDLAPHHEGGWFRRTWTAPAPEGQRPPASAVHYLLEAHEISRWHRIDADELWLWQGGAPLELSLAPGDSGPVTSAELGPLSPQVLVPAHHWQTARPLGGWTLVSCVVSPAFDFAGWELAEDGWVPG